MANCPVGGYKNYRVSRAKTYKTYDEFLWFMSDFKKEHNLSGEMFLELIHKYIHSNLINVIKNEKPKE